MLLIWLGLFTFLTPLVIYLQALVNMPVLVAGFSIPLGHILELVLSFTVITILYTLIVREYLLDSVSKKNVSWVLPLLFSFFVLSLYGLGNGVHFSANSLHHFIITNKISGELKEIAYLYDEKLSHLIWTPALGMMPFSFAFWELWSKKVQAVSKLQQIFALGLGGIFGGLMSLAVLEAQMGKLMFIPLALGLGFLTLGLLRFKLWNKLGWLYALSFSGTTLVAVALWIARYGSNAEPLNVLF